MQAVLGQHKMTVLAAKGDPKDHTPLPAYHYDDTMDNRSEFTRQCWIPAEPGSTFCIHYCWDGKLETKPAEKAFLVCKLYIDELFIMEDSLLLRGINNRSGKNREREITGMFYNGPAGAAERRFMFKETSIDVDADTLDTSNKGTIRVVLHWEKPDYEGEGQFVAPPTRNKEEVDEMILGLETSINSGNDRLRSCVGFGDPVKMERVNVKFKRVDKKDYTFIFHYAHPDWLKSEGIIPPKVSSIYRTQAGTPEPLE